MPLSEEELLSIARNYWRSDKLYHYTPGEVLNPLPPWPTEPIVPTVLEERAKGRVVVELLAPPEGFQGPYTLTLWDTDGQRPVIPRSNPAQPPSISTGAMIGLLRRSAEIG